VGLKEEQYIQLFRSTTSMISFRDRLCYEIMTLWPDFELI